ncbi:MAG: MYXO-CTERM sorting domain-containing protein [bacterium]
MRPQSTSKVVEVGAEADIGALELTAISPTIGELTVPNDGSCTWDVTATYSRISVTRSQGWYDEGQLIFRTYVDDQIYEPRLSDCSRAFPNGSWQGVSDDIVMMYCDDVGHDGVPPGIHHVRMEATLGTNPMVFASQEIELDLSGCQTAPEADAGTREDVGSDDLGAPSPQANGEGGCSATGGPTTAPWFAALFFGALLRLRRVRT